MRSPRHVWLVVFATFLVVSQPVAAAPSSATGTPAPVADASGDDIEIRYTVEQTDDPETVRVTATIHEPPQVSEYKIYNLPDSIDVVDTAGFNENNEENSYDWNGYVAPASITYDISADPSGDLLSGNSAATDEWAFVSSQDIQFRIHYWYRGDQPGVVRTLDHDGEGYSGVSLAHLGAYTASTSDDGAEDFTLIMPDQASPTATTDAILASLNEGSHQLDVGSNSDHVNVFVAQSPVRTGGATPWDEQDGAMDFWAHESSAVNSSSNTWLHEYFHTRQSYNPSTSMDWALEGQADYYEALLSLQQGRISYDSFQQHLNTNYPDATLTDPDSWDSQQVQYQTGRVTFAALDAEVRNATDGEKTLQHVVKEMNQHDGKLTVEAFNEALADVTGEDFSDWTATYVEGSETPAVPDDPSLYIHTDATRDSSGNGLSDAHELANGTHPFKTDTDGDGLTDYEEIEVHDTDPLMADMDGDGLSDGDEIAILETDPTRADTDGDGLTDYTEVDLLETDPLAKDTSGDGITDAAALYQYGADPTTTIPDHVVWLQNKR